ncbi:MAG: NAD(P)H-dependent oxidoreductase [Lactobacillus sp.]|uniref:flavodoxin n=1 Tax=Lactobacillus sp. TaxID=1591 RepID=UPI0023D6A6F9|nr:flavodoxin [Lactobacillus sp.]MDE7050221.1 NAD(P)H-dependent oxidoreductase [Lactobacillus sp.]
MKKRIIAFVSVIVVVIAAIVGFNVYRSSQNNSAQNSNTATKTSVKKSGKVTTKGKNGKVLVVYFSRTKGVYGGNLSRGNTARVADFIQEKTKGDSYEIVPQKAYPNGYDATTRVAQREQDQNARPAIKNALPNVKKYSTVFIGAPIWWGEYPMIVRTFIDNVDLNGKTVIAFTTAEGSGLGNTAETLRKAYPKAKVRKGFTTEGNNVKNDPSSVRSDVNSWLDGLGY